MANVLLTFANVDPDSLNGAIADRLEATLTELGHEVRRNDLYQRDFDPLLGVRDFEAWQRGAVPDDVAAEQADVDWADALAFVFPIWWHMPPAKLKGWFDRVLTQPWAWVIDEDGHAGKLTDKRAFVAVTYGSPVPIYDKLAIDREVIKQPVVKGTLNFCGITDVRYVEEFGVLAQDRPANEDYVERVAREARSFFG